MLGALLAVLGTLLAALRALVTARGRASPSESKSSSSSSSYGARGRSTVYQTAAAATASSAVVNSGGTANRMAPTTASPDGTMTRVACRLSVSYSSPPRHLSPATTSIASMSTRSTTCTPTSR
ncbi:hypothetical protein ACFQYP_48180 [Nonomuraea antimicrobica]